MKVGFSGRSIRQVEELIEGLQYFKFLEYVGGVFEVSEEFALQLEFSSSDVEQKTKIWIKNVLKKYDLHQIWAKSDNPKLQELRLSRFSPGPLEKLHLDGVRAIEAYLIEAKTSGGIGGFHLPLQFATRGFDPKKF
jgi:hypothetical protein